MHADTRKKNFNSSILAHFKRFGQGNTRYYTDTNLNSGLSLKRTDRWAFQAAAEHQPTPATFPPKELSPGAKKPLEDLLIQPQEAPAHLSLKGDLRIMF